MTDIFISKKKITLSILTINIYPFLKPKKHMKKLIAIVSIAAFMTACNGNQSSTSEMTTSDSTSLMKGSSMSHDSSMSMSTMNAPMDLKEGMMIMKGGKMMVMKEGKTKEMDQTMTCTDGCKVKPSGEVVMKDGKTMMMKEGEVIDKDGNMMNDNGKMMMDNGKMMKDSMK